MAKFQALLNLRLKQKENQKPKMSELAERSSSGNLSSFSGVFRVNSLNESEKEKIETILNEYRSSEESNIQNDLKELMMITSEVKAITNQAVILHGERIKKAQQILKNYQDGAFSAWLLETYGNRQTPYNFLQYYEFYMAMPPTLHPKIDQMPRQAVYTLATRTGPLEKKEEIVQNYNEEPKQELLRLIRKMFPLSKEDKRHPNYTSQVINHMKKALLLSKEPFFLPSKEQKKELLEVLSEIRDQIKE